jgi:hypothetical protein
MQRGPAKQTHLTKDQVLHGHNKPISTWTKRNKSYMYKEK